METVRLRAIQQQPARVERLLVAFAAKSGILPHTAYMLRDARALPEVLQRVTLRAESQEQAWCCWSDDDRLWLFSGELSLPLSQKCGAPVLNVSIYNRDGDLIESGCWVADGEGQWRRCAD